MTTETRSDSPAGILHMLRGPFSKARSPAVLGALSIEEEAAEAVPERETCEQHRPDPHQQPQRPAPPPPGTSAARRHLAAGRNSWRSAFPPGDSFAVRRDVTPAGVPEPKPFELQLTPQRQGSHASFETFRSASQSEGEASAFSWLPEHPDLWAFHLFSVTLQAEILQVNCGCPERILH